jgi:hypothetical protein
MARVTEEAEKKEKPVSRAQMEKEVTAVRKQVHDILTKAQERSEKSGKPLLIMVGENHISAESALLESIIYQEAKALGIQNIALETSKKLQPRLLQMPISKGTITGLVLMSRYAEYDHLNLHYVDTRGDQITLGTGKSFDPKLNSRNETIAANLINIHQPTLMLTGAHHLDGLNGDLPGLQKNYEVVSFNTFDKRNDFRSNNKNTPIHTLKLSGTDMNCAEYLFDRQLDKGLISWMEEKGFKLSETKAKAIVSGANKDHTKPSAVPMAKHFDRAIAYYELGQYNSAAQELGYAANQTKKNLKIKGIDNFNDLSSADKEFIINIGALLESGSERSEGFAKAFSAFEKKNTSPVATTSTYTEKFKDLGIAPSNHLPYSDAPHGVPLAPAYHPPVQAKDKPPEAPKMAKPAPKGWSL